MLARRVRAGEMEATAAGQTRTQLAQLAGDWFEIGPADSVRGAAERLLVAHSLRASDAFQLAAALEWCEGRPENAGFVSLDVRLRDAAGREGFAVFPAAL